MSQIIEVLRIYLPENLISMHTQMILTQHY